MLNIITGTLILAGAFSGYVTVFGSRMAVFVVGGIMIAMGVRKVIKKQMRKKRELAKGSLY